MSEDSILALMAAHLARYPESGILDVYKLLHQGAFGPGHLIANRRNAREWLEHECAQVQPDRMRPLVESIHPEGEVVRLHLRPYLAYQESVRTLLDAFVRSAQQVTPGPIAAWWAVFEARCAQRGVWAERFNLREVQLFGQTRAAEQWPAMHHSPQYADVYHPAYRVLTRAEAESLCAKINAPFEVI